MNITYYDDSGPTEPLEIPDAQLGDTLVLEGQMESKHTVTNGFKTIGAWPTKTSRVFSFTNICNDVFELLLSTIENSCGHRVIINHLGTAYDGVILGNVTTVDNGINKKELTFTFLEIP